MSDRVAVYSSDGNEWPAWCLRAGQLITATDYDHGKGVLKVWVRDESLPPEPVVSSINPP